MNNLAHRVRLKWSYYRTHRSLCSLKKATAASGKFQKIVAISQIVHLGDIVACEPIIRQVRVEYPHAIIVFAVQRDYRELIDHHPDVDLVLPLLCISEWIWLVRLGLFYKVIDLNIYERSCPICLVPWRKPGGSNGVVPANYYEHGSLINAYAKSAGIETPPFGPQVFTSEADRRTVDEFHLPRIFVCIHARSNEECRELPASAWRTLIEHVSRRWQVLVIEVGTTPYVVENDSGLTASYCGKLTILQTAEVIRRASIFIGIDSGPAHIANAVGTYGIIALGWYRNFKKYLPYSGNYGAGVDCEILRHEGPVAEMPVSRIVDAVDKRLNETVFK